MRVLVILCLALSLVACELTPGQQSTTYGDPIVIGVPISLTGNLSNEGSMAKQGYDLWTDWVNGQKGGIEVSGVRHRVQVHYADDQSSPAIAAKLAEDMIAVQKARFLLGPYGASNTAAVAAVAEQHHVPLISANGSARSIFSQGYRYVFGVQTPADRALQPIFDLAGTLHPAPTSVALLTANDPFSVEVAQGAKDYATSKGLKIVFDKQYPSGSTNLYDLLSQAKGQNPDIVLNSGHLIEAIAVSKGSKELRLNARMFAYSVGPTMTQFVTALGKDADYTVTGTQWTAQAKYRPSYYLTVQKYVSAYQQKFQTDQEPNYQVADATAAGLALEQAIQHANSLDADRVRNALASLDVNTFYGRIKFDSTGQNTFKPMLVEQIQAGRRQTVWPQDLAGTTAQYPTPIWTVRAGLPPEPKDAKLPPTGKPFAP